MENSKSTASQPVVQPKFTRQAVKQGAAELIPDKFIVPIGVKIEAFLNELNVAVPKSGICGKDFVTYDNDEAKMGKPPTGWRVWLEHRELPQNITKLFTVEAYKAAMQKFNAQVQAVQTAAADAYENAGETVEKVVSPFAFVQHSKEQEVDNTAATNIEKDMNASIIDEDVPTGGVEPLSAEPFQIRSTVATGNYDELNKTLDVIHPLHAAVRQFTLDQEQFDNTVLSWENRIENEKDLNEMKEIAKAGLNTTEEMHMKFKKIKKHDEECKENVKKLNTDIFDLRTQNDKNKDEVDRVRNTNKNLEKQCHDSMVNSGKLQRDFIRAQRERDDLQVKLKAEESRVDAELKKERDDLQGQWICIEDEFDKAKTREKRLAEWEARLQQAEDAQWEDAQYDNHEQPRVNTRTDELIERSIALMEKFDKSGKSTKEKTHYPQNYKGTQESGKVEKFILDCERCQDLNGWDDKQLIDKALSNSLKDDAYLWYADHKKKNPDKDWKYWKGVLLSHFSSESDPAEIRQAMYARVFTDAHTVNSYVDGYLNWFNTLGTSEEERVSILIQGLRPHRWRWFEKLTESKPKTVEDVCTQLKTFYSLKSQQVEYNNTRNQNSNSYSNNGNRGRGGYRGNNNRGRGGRGGYGNYRQNSYEQSGSTYEKGDSVKAENTQNSGRRPFMIGNVEIDLNKWKNDAGQLICFKCHELHPAKFCTFKGKFKEATREPPADVLARHNSRRAEARAMEVCKLGKDVQVNALSVERMQQLSQFPDAVEKGFEVALPTLDAQAVYVMLAMNDNDEVKTLVDTGASISIMPIHIALMLNVSILKCPAHVSDVTLNTAANDITDIDPLCGIVRIELFGIGYEHAVLIDPNTKVDFVLLGTDFWTGKPVVFDFSTMAFRPTRTEPAFPRYHPRAHLKMLDFVQQHSFKPVLNPGARPCPTIPAWFDTGRALEYCKAFDGSSVTYDHLNSWLNKERSTMAVKKAEVLHTSSTKRNEVTPQKSFAKAVKGNVKILKKPQNALGATSSLR
ncbi:uncharacterized protein LOC129591411 [Paramacrobiotus metropolitanus]|uniref:uncharacterized protein LOC129591411 n=1 Tax=Paramacrobiotus metropolitanus TaxID=2943436 RepID=UPI0024461D7C|nr:uncharacterized protein LOC129591411 [Paramacrobiotus metropolitanus]